METACLLEVVDKDNNTSIAAEAGNYKKGHIVIGDFDISIENPAGSECKDVDAAGNLVNITN